MRLSNGTIRHRRRSMNLPGHAHELTFSTYRGYKLLSKDRTRVWFIEAVQRARQLHNFHVWSYVIMPEHIHLVIMPQQEDYRIEDILKSIKQPVGTRALAFLEKENPAWLRRHLSARRRNGKIARHFWQPGGGYDRSIISVKTLKYAIDYIHANPLRRDLCVQVEEWEWSSARWWGGCEDVPLAMDEIRSANFRDP